MELQSCQAAWINAGHAGTRASRRRALRVAWMGKLNLIAAALSMHKDAEEVRTIKAAYAQAIALNSQINGQRPVKGLSFVPIVVYLSGPGRDFLKSVEYAVILLPEYQADIEVGVEQFAREVEAKGGVAVLWVIESSGGHVIPVQVAVEAVQRRMGCPEIRVLELLEPDVKDELAHRIWVERTRYLIESNFQGYTNVFLRRNDLGSTFFASLDEFDDIGDWAFTLWLGAEGPNQTNLPEILSYLQKGSQVAGVWGVRVPWPAIREPREFMGIPLGWKRVSPDERLVRHNCLAALTRVGSDPTTSLTGLPPLEGAFYGLVLPQASEQLIADLRKAWSAGPLTVVQCPLAKYIYAIRISPVDWSPLAQALGVQASSPRLAGLGWKPGRTRDFREAMKDVEKHLQVGDGRMASLWNRTETEERGKA